MRLGLHVALSNWLNIAFCIRYWEKWIIFWFLKIECVFQYGLTDIYVIVLQLFFKRRPLFLIIFTSVPYLIVSESFIEGNLLTKSLHKCLYRIIDLLFFSLFSSSIPWCLSLIQIILKLFVLETLISIWSFSIKLFIIILALGRSVRNIYMFLRIFDGVK